MEKERLRKIVCTTLVVMVACLSLVSIALAEDGEVTLKKGIHLPSYTPAPHVSGLVIPGNDECGGAVSINDGPYPVCSPITTGILDATNANDPIAPATCVGTGNFTSHSIWYTWTPASTAFYKILDCPGGSCGPGTSLTEPGDGVIHVYTSDAGCGGTFTNVGCNDDGCGGVGVQSSLIGSFTGGTTYYILVGYWDDGANATPFDQAQIRIEIVPPPPNDTCGTATPLVLNQIQVGNINPLATNNYQLGSTACYTAGGQQGNGVCTGGPTPGAVCTSTANCGVGGTCSQSALAGKDVAYSFTAPDEDDYSFRVTLYDGGTNNGLMILGACDPGPVVASCLRAVNRNTPLTAAPFGAEEVSCLHLTAGQTVYPIVDNTANSTTALSSFRIQVERCRAELEFNGTPAGAEDPAGDGSDPPNSVSRGCPVEGGAFQGLPGGDVDFFTLDAPAAGTRVFAQVDGNSCPPSSASTSGVNFDMRVTTDVDTLEFDDANNNSSFGGFSPNIGGTVLLGGPAYLRVSMGTATAFAEPYRLFTTLRAPGSGPLGTSAGEEPGPDDDSAFPVGDYFYGNVDNRDAHCAGHPEIVCTSAGDCPDAGSGETCNDTFDTDFYGFCARAGEQVFVSVDADPSRDNTPLYSGLFLFNPSGSQLFGIGDLAAQGTTSSTVPSPATLVGTTPFSPSQAVNTLSTQTGLFNVAVNGQAIVAGGLLSSGDYLLSMSSQCSSQESDLAITKTGDAAAVAGGNVNYSITVTNNGPAMGTAAFFHDTTPAGTTFVSISIPDGWDCATPIVGSAGDIDCFELSGCFDGSASFDLVLNVSQCAGNGDITNSVEVFGATSDPDSSNNVANAVTTVSDPGTCDDGDPCTENDSCTGTVCGGTALDCDDSNGCTDDSCDAGNCVNTNNTSPCDDGNGCTTGDVCDGGSCTSGAPNNDPCDDGNACTTNDTCGGGSCNGGAGPDCNDGNICTDDSCDPGTGCVNACNNTCNTKGQGYWKRLCHGPHTGDFYTQADVDCVNNSCTFSGVSTISDLCDEIQPTPANDKCEKAEAKFLSLLLNACRCRVNPGQSLNSRCGPGTTVAAAIAASDATLCNPGRTAAECNHADCATFEIINGEAMWANSLRLTTSGTSVRLTWEPPYASPDTLTQGGVKKYHVYRRAQGSTGVFTQIGIVNPNQALTYLDTTAGSGSWTYEVTSEY
jgi:uncharacterized repeat protein (TIGR01451 family)